MSGGGGESSSSASSPRPKWVGMTRRNSVIGGNNATDAMWHQLGAHESDDHLHALAEVRAHQEGHAAGGHASGEAATISVTVPAHVLNPYLFVRQVEAQTKKDAVKQNLANLERRRRRALQKETSARAAVQAEQDDKNADDKTRMMLLRARGVAAQWGGEGGEDGQAEGGGDGGSPKFRDMSWARDMERGHDAKGVVAWHESPAKGRGRGTHRAAGKRRAWGLKALRGVVCVCVCGRVHIRRTRVLSWALL